MTEIKLSKEQSDFIENIGTVVYLGNGDEYIHLPYWFNKSDSDGLYKLYTFENIPKELTEFLRNTREHNID